MCICVFKSLHKLILLRGNSNVLQIGVTLLLFSARHTQVREFPFLHSYSLALECVLDCIQCLFSAPFLGLSLWGTLIHLFQPALCGEGGLLALWQLAGFSQWEGPLRNLKMPTNT